MELLEVKILDDFIKTLEKMILTGVDPSYFDSFTLQDKPQMVQDIAKKFKSISAEFQNRENDLKYAITELRYAKDELGKMNQLLDTKVEERTKALQDANTLLESIAITDSLTGISNRRFFDEILQKEFARARRHDVNLTCIMSDIDHFKKVNDNYGHVMGDKALKKFGTILRNNLRGHDIFARYGGEEFVMLLPETDAPSSMIVTEKIRKEIEKTKIKMDGKTLQITASFGIAQLDKTLMKKPNDLVKAADNALYEAKTTGRNKSMTFKPR